MITRSRVVVALASLALLTLFFLPLWRIALEAPQYPEGLGMYIRVNTVGSMHGNDLQSINELNHYVGMKPITAAAIPELHWMPWIVVGLTVLGLLAAAIGRRGTLLAWLGTLVTRRQPAHAAVVWTANVLAALAFGAAHLPNASSLGASLTPAVIAFVLVGNGLVGLGCGWLFWRRGLLSAILAHFAADIVLKVIVPAVAS